jgi:hypothetical protein
VENNYSQPAQEDKKNILFYVIASTTKSIVIWLLCWSIIVYFLFFAPVKIRFQAGWINELISIIVLLGIPFTLSRIKPEPTGVLLFLIKLIQAVILLPASLFVFFSFISIIQNLLPSKNTGFDEMFYEYKYDNSYYRLYRINPGAMSSYSLSLTKETPFLSFLKLVKPIEDFNPGATGRIQKITPDKLRLIWSIGNEKDPQNIYDFTP